MTRKIVEFVLIVRPGRYDFHGLKEHIKEAIQRLASIEGCAIVADFGSEKFAIGPRALLSHLVPSLPQSYPDSGFTFYRSSSNYLYESCHLHVRVDSTHSARVSALLDGLSKSIEARGERVEIYNAASVSPAKKS